MASALPQSPESFSAFTERDHGWYSEYAQFNSIRERVLTNVIVEGDTEEHEDYIPSMRHPQPTLHGHYLPNLSDPDLCITPEKSSKSKKSKDKKGNSPTKLTGSPTSGKFHGSRSSLKVRFDDVVNVKHLSPDYSAVNYSSLDNDEFDNDSLRNISGALLTESDQQFSKERGTETDEASTSSPQAKTYKYRTVFSSSSSPTISPTNSPPNGSRTVDARQKLSMNSAEDMTDTTESPGLISLSSKQLPHENILARPEFHSTLRISKKINEVLTSELDVAAALKNTLKVSEKTQSEIEEKAFSKVNIQETRYADLVSIHVQENDVIDAISQERAAQVKPTHKSKSRPEDHITGAPDIMEFFSEAVQKETASFTLPGITIMRPYLKAADPMHAFDIYQHIRTWDSS